MACRSGCLTQDHESWAACARASNIRVGWSNSAAGLDLTTQKKWDKELNEYATARQQGIQPKSTKTSDIRAAVEISNLTGSAFNADSTSAVA